MADEAVGQEPEAPEVQPAAVESPPEPETPAPETVVDEGEPGGTDGTAVYARKQYREAKRLREEKAQLELEHARLKGEVEALRAQPKAPAKDELTIERVEEAMRAGTVDPIAGNRWIARKEAELLLAARDTERKRQEPLERAGSDLSEYVELMPDLRNPGSKAVEAVNAELRILTQYGYDEKDVRTQLIAVERAHGALGSRRSKHNVDNLTRTTLAPHNERPAGGTPPSNGKLNLKDAPADLKALWDKQGTPEASRLKQLKHYQERQEARAARFQSFTGRGR